MANTYTQIHIQAVFAVKYRAALIGPEWKDRLHRYMIAIVNNHDHEMLQINSMPDHIHLLFGFRPIQSLSDLMGIVKRESSEWLNKEKIANSYFRWQEGYGAFSYSRSQVSSVATYIQNQEMHHKKKSFIQEYESLLEKFEIPYDKRYIFKEPE